MIIQTCKIGLLFEIFDHNSQNRTMIEWFIHLSIHSSIYWLIDQLIQKRKKPSNSSLSAIWLSDQLFWFEDTNLTHVRLVCTIHLTVWSNTFQVYSRKLDWHLVLDQYVSIEDWDWAGYKSYHLDDWLSPPLMDFVMVTSLLEEIDVCTHPQFPLYLLTNDILSLKQPYIMLSNISCHVPLCAQQL